MGRFFNAVHMQTYTQTHKHLSGFLSFLSISHFFHLSSSHLPITASSFRILHAGRDKPSVFSIFCHIIKMWDYDQVFHSIPLCIAHFTSNKSQIRAYIQLQQQQQLYWEHFPYSIRKHFCKQQLVK